MLLSALMVQTVSSLEDSVSFYRTARRIIPKDSHFQAFRSQTSEELQNGVAFRNVGDFKKSLQLVIVL
jgi:hypothetical protein